MDIVARAAIVFVFLWVITRIVGRSTLGELSTFQLIVFITMGDLIQQAVTQQDYSITAAVLAVGTFAVLTILLAWLNTRFPSLRPVLHGHPLVIVRSGEPLLDVLRTVRMPIHDLYAAARQQGISHLSHVELAVLEVNGQVSFFTEDPGEHEGAPPRPTVG